MKIYLIMFRSDIRRLAVQTDRVADPVRDFINHMMAAILHPRPDVRRIILSSTRQSQLMEMVRVYHTVWTCVYR
jgi:hypothetical protein